MTRLDITEEELISIVEGDDNDYNIGNYERPKFNQREVLDTFMPDCLPAIKRNITLLKKKKTELESICGPWLDRSLEKIYTEFSDQNAINLFWIPEAKWFCYDRVIDPINDKIKELEQLLKMSQIKDLGTPNAHLDLQRAKEYPIKNLIKVGYNGFANCPFHVDKTPSMKVDKKNRFHCFSCGLDGDVIDLYQKMNNCDFKTAVSILNK